MEILALAAGLLLGGWVFNADAQTTYDWRSDAPDGYWKQGAGGARWDPGGLWDEPPYGIIRFNNNAQLTMNNNVAGTYSQHQIIFGAGNTSDRSIAGNDVRLYDYSGADPKLENQSTGNHSFTLNLAGDGDAGDPWEINPVSGNLALHGGVNNQNADIYVYGNNDKTLTIGGVLSGSGMLYVRQHSLAVLTNNNTFTGGSWVEKGRLRLQGHTNAVGGAAFPVVYVGTNATLELNLGAARHKPMDIRLYGTGTNSSAGAIRKIATGNEYLQMSRITLGQDARINVDSGSLYLTRTTNDLAGYTLYIGGPNSLYMDTGAVFTNATKVAGDGAIYKDGAGIFELRPNIDMTGTVTLAAGDTRQSANASGTGLPKGGVLAISGGAMYSSDGTTARTIYKDLIFNGNGGLAINSSGALTFHGNLSLGNGMRMITNVNQVSINGLVTNGGLGKAGTGTLILTNANTYAGGTLVSAGILQGDSKGLQGFITNNAGVVFDQAVAGTYGGVMSGTGYLTKQGAGTLTMTNANTYAGGTLVSIGTLQGDAKGLQGNITNNVAVVFDQAGAGTYAGIMSGTGTMTKQGSGALTLTGTSTHSGNTTVSAGALIQNGTNTSSAVTLNSGAFLYGCGRTAGLTISGRASAGNASNAVGQLTTGVLNLENDGILQVELSAMSGTAGSDWDLVDATGNITVNAVDGNDFIIALKGNPAGFNSALGFTNKLMQTSGTISGFDPAKFTVNTNEFTPDLAGGVFSVAQNGTEIWLVFTPSAVSVPNIVLLGTNLAAIANGASAPTLVDGTDYGVVNIDGATKTHTFVITNTGTANLTFENVAIGGTAAADFTVTAQPSSPVAAGDQATFQIRFDPSATGTRSATVYITNNVAAKNPYTFAIQGTGVVVQVDVIYNGTKVPDGDASPTSAKGTDFGNVGLMGGTLTRLFTVTNWGSAELTLGTVTTSGTHAADFLVISGPTSPVPIGASTLFQVQFNPSAVGTRSAAISFSNNSITNNPYEFAVQGVGVAAAISNNPTAISVSSTLGSVPSASNFGLTNVGLGTLSYTITTNASWLVVAPVSGSLAGGAGAQHSVTFQAIAGMQAGTSNAIITVTDADATNSPQTVAVAWTINAIPNPSAGTATADGNEMIRLAWTKDAGYNVMIVHRAGSASTAPAQGQSYNVGDACGSGTVIYKGAGAALEHMVAAGAAHHYAFYSYNGNYYSAGITDDDTLGSYRTGEIVDPFAYTNGAAANSDPSGKGQGWSGAWAGDNPGDFTISSGSFNTQANYPSNTANKVLVTPPSDNNRTMRRTLGNVYTSGKLYVAYIMNYQWSGAGKWSGLSMMYDGTEKLFLGEIYDADQTLGIGSTSAGKTILAGGGNDYIIIGRYDWSQNGGRASVVAYKIGTDTVPQTEPADGSWNLNTDIASNTVGSVNAIRLGAGAGAGMGTPGDVYFDEVRVATNWSDLLGVLPVKPLDTASASATADGNEMLRLEWAKNASSDSVMILHKSSAISTDPTDGTAYAEGNTIDGATVIYKGAALKLEHVVAPGSSAYYKFYSYNGANYYSTGRTANVTLDNYASYERANPFSYTNGSVLGSAQIGGQGFGNNSWSTGGNGAWNARTNYATAVADAVPRFVNIANYPNMQGNLLHLSGLSDGQSGYAERSLAAAINTGTVYVAFMMAYQYYGADKWAGLAFYNGATEKAFFGKGGGANWNTLAVGDGASTYWSSVDLFPIAGGSGNTGNVYLVAGKYDFSTKQLQAKAYRLLNDTFPDTEPGTWDVSTTLGTGIDSIDRIQLRAGCSAAANIGDVFFDEIRYGTNWSQLLAVTCPTWIGSNRADKTTGVYLGDYVGFQIQTYPIGAGQSAALEFDWGNDGSWNLTNAMTHTHTANDNSYWTNRQQMIQAGDAGYQFKAWAGACSVVTTNPLAPITVNALINPSNCTAVADTVNSNSQINLEWAKNPQGHDVMVVRNASDSFTAPTGGQAYYAGNSIGSGTVIYRGAATNFSDTGLGAESTNYYRFYSENYTYYSGGLTVTGITKSGATVIIIDGNPADWQGTPPVALNAATISRNEWIWKDKSGEVRSENANHGNADVKEMRIYADATYVYFLLKITNITDVANPYVAIGVDTRRSSSSASMNWLGDDSYTFYGGGYYGSGAAPHYAERNIIVHRAGGAIQVELYADGGSSWYAPGATWEGAMSTTYDGIEFKIERSYLNLTGAITGRFTVATFLNADVWANDGKSTVRLVENTADAADALSIPPYQQNDPNADMSAWLEDLSDNNVDFYFDVRLNSAGVAGNTLPSAPEVVSPTNTARMSANPVLIWKAATDSDGEITGYLLEVSTNSTLNGVDGTENGPITLRVNLPATQTNYTLSSSVTQYYWRVRARDTAGELSSAQINMFTIGGKSDVEGPLPTLMYIGTNVQGFLDGEFDAHIAQYGPIQSITDAEVKQQDCDIGFVLRFDDPSGVYATNKRRADVSNPGAFAWNIVSDNGRVSPNWDILEINTTNDPPTTNDWGKDVVFYGSNLYNNGNAGLSMTGWVHQAFKIASYNTNIEYYLTVSAEDACTEGGSWWAYGSWSSYQEANGACEDGPNTARNVTTNYLIRIHVVDDDSEAPLAATGRGWSDQRSLMISNATAELASSGTGRQVMYTATDGSLVGNTLTFLLNMYDYYSGIALDVAGPGETNTTLSVGNWQVDNYGDLALALSDIANTRSTNTLLTWQWAGLTAADMTALWGGDGSGDVGITNWVTSTTRDLDGDRPADQDVTTNLLFGFLNLSDDDYVKPVAGKAMNILLGTTAVPLTNGVTNLLAGWNFNNSDTLVSHGSGVLYTNFNTVSYSAGITTNAYASDPAGQDLTIQGGAALVNNGKYLLFNLDMSGRKDLVMTFAVRRSATGFNNNQVAYSLDGSSFTDFGAPFNPSDGYWSLATVDFSSATALNNATSVFIRILLDGATLATGNNRYDNFQFNAALALATLTDAQLAAVTAGDPLQFNFNAYDAYSGLARGTTANGTNLNISVDDWLTNNAAQYSSDHSTVDSTDAAATSAWAWASFDPDLITTLVGAGNSNRAIRATGADADNDRTGDALYFSNVLYGTVRIIDDDAIHPTNSAAPLEVKVGGTLAGTVTGTTGTNTRYRLTDGALANAGATLIDLGFNVWDTNSGINRATTSPATAMHISVEGWLTNNVANYAAGRSSADTTVSTATSTWTIASSMSISEVDALYGTDVNGTGTLRMVSANVVDADADRTSDALWGPTNQQMGFVQVVDDDAQAPVIADAKVTGTGSGLTLSGGLVNYPFTTDGGETFNNNPLYAIAHASGSAFATLSGAFTTNASGNPNFAIRSSGWGVLNYWEFSIAVEAGYVLSITNMAFDDLATATGPTAWRLHYSGDGYAAAVSTGVTHTAWSGNMAGLALAGLSGTTTFRLMGTNAASGGGTWSIDNVLLQGTVSPAPGSGYVSDQDLALGSCTITGLVSDAISGLYSNKGVNGTVYDLFSNQQQVQTNKPFAQGPTVNGAGLTATGLYDTISVNTNIITLGVYTAVVYATDYDEDRTADAIRSTNTQTFTVVDDDDQAPAWGERMRMSYASNNVSVSSGSGTNAVFNINDGRLRGLSVTNALQFIYFVNDVSGLVRGTADPEVNSHMSVEMAITNDVANFDLAASSPDGYKGNLISNIWTFVSPFSYDHVTALFQTTNRVLLTLRDADFDRANDQLCMSNAQYGFLTVGDDDSVPPQPRFTSSAFTNQPCLDMWLGGDTNLGYTGTNLWVASDDPASTNNFSNQVYSVSDGALTNLPASAPLHLRFWVWDNLSALNIGGADPSTNCNISIGAVITDNISDFEPAWSRGSTFANQATQYWTFTSFDTNTVGQFYDAAGHSNRVTMNAWDGDRDRAGDSTNTILQFGHMVVYDDDVVGPTTATNVEGGHVFWTNNTNVLVRWDTSTVHDVSGVGGFRISTNVPVSINEGTAIGMATQVVYGLAPENQGVFTNWLFGFDADGDRPDDAMFGGFTNFVTMLDITSPTQMVNAGGAAGYDDTSEIDMHWSQLANAGNYGSVELSPWASYRIYYTDDLSVPTTNSAYWAASQYASMGYITNEFTTITNLDFGAEYGVAMAGVDQAGNVGPLSTSMFISLSGFIVTQGLAKFNLGQVDISWRATNRLGEIVRGYDLVYVDTWKYRDALTNSWRFIGCVTNSVYTDGGGTNPDDGSTRPPPADLGTIMRFYRASTHDRWRTNNTRRLASEEVYVMRPVQLFPGRNWVSFPGIADTDTPARVLGHSLPQGIMAALATTVTWYEKTTNAYATNLIWLGTSSGGTWYRGGVNVDNVPLNFGDGMLIQLPTNAAAQTLLFVGRIPTNGPTHYIKGGARVSPVYNLVGFNVPTYMHPSEMNLLPSGFKGGTTVSRSDRLLLYDRANQMIKNNAGVWYDTSTSRWRLETGGDCPWDYFGPDDGLVIYSANAGDWVWTNNVPYSPPNRYMAP